MKRSASAATVAGILLLVPVIAAGPASADTYYPSCKAALAAGQSNIHRGEPGYRPALDRDHDGVACDEGDPATTGGGAGSSGQDVGVSDPSTGDDVGSGASTGTSGSAGSSDSTSSSGSTADQIAVVPQGGAETGDGSTEGHTGWWIGGAFLAGLAGLVTARRARVAGRR
jgi:Excalibur calcium-binding domain